ncbi:MAG: hypothetical protein B7Z70_14225, partial [Acidithiobacillus ferrivorans]
MTAAPLGALGMSGRDGETAPSRTEKRHERRRDGNALATPNSAEALFTADYLDADKRSIANGITIEFKDTPLSKVVDDLRSYSNMNIVIDQKAVEDGYSATQLAMLKQVQAAEAVKAAADG